MTAMLDSNAAQHCRSRLLHILRRRRPIRDRDSHCCFLLPRRTGQPAGPFFLHAADDVPRELIAVAEANEHLVENDVVEDGHARIASQQLRKLERALTTTV